MTTASQGFRLVERFSPSESRPTSLPSSSSISMADSVIKTIISRGAIHRLNFLRTAKELSASSSSSVDEVSLFNGGVLPIDFTEVEINALKKIAEGAHKSFFGVLESIILANVQILKQSSMGDIPEEVRNKMLDAQIHLLRYLNNMADEKEIPFKCNFIKAADLASLTHKMFNRGSLTALIQSEIESLNTLIAQISSVPVEDAAASEKVSEHSDLSTSVSASNSSSDAAGSMAASEHSALSTDVVASKVKAELKLNGLMKLQTHLLLIQKICTLETQNLLSLSFNKEKIVDQTSVIIEHLSQFISLYQLASKSPSVQEVFLPILEKLIELDFNITPWNRHPFDRFYNTHMQAFNGAVEQLYHLCGKEALRFENLKGENLENTLDPIDVLQELVMMENFLDTALKSIHHHSNSCCREWWVIKFEKYIPRCVELLKISSQSTLLEEGNASASQEPIDIKPVLQKFNENIKLLFKKIPAAEELYQFANYVQKVLAKPADELSLYYYYKIASAFDRNVLTACVNNVSSELEVSFNSLIDSVDELKSDMSQKELNDLKTALFADNTQLKTLLFAISGLQIYLNATNKSDRNPEISGIDEIICYDGEPLHLAEGLKEALECVLKSFCLEPISDPSTSNPNTEASDDDIMFRLDDYRPTAGTSTDSFRAETHQESSDDDVFNME